MASVVCKDALKQVLGSKVSDAKVDAVERIISRKMRELGRSDPTTWSRLTPRERIVAGTDQAVVELRSKEQAKKRAAILQVQALRSNRLSVEALKQPKKNWATALGDRLNQVYNTQQTMARQFFSESKTRLDEVTDGDFFALLQNPRNALHFVREIDGEAPGNQQMAAAAKEWLDFTEGKRQRANRAGTNIGKLDYGYIPQSHDTIKIRKVKDGADGSNQWVEDVLPWLRRDHYLREDGAPMSDDELRAFLKEAKTTLETDGLNTQIPGQRRGTGTGASRLGNQHREIHLSADGWVQYNQKYGRGTLFEALQNHTHRMARDIALFEEMGTVPENTFQYLKGIVEKNDGGEETLGLGGFAVRPVHIWDVVSGLSSRAVNQTTANMHNNITNLLVAARLGKAVISAVTDLGSVFVTARYNKLPVMRIYMETIRAGGKEGREMAQMHGLIAESIIGDGNKLILELMTDNWSAKVANGTLRWQGLHRLTDTLRRAHSIVHMQALAEMRLTAWDS